ncbi:HTH_48 domain-containing protein [Trichonephila clavipes]|nr:HTH_48 domain-containing protein [Trichonephila clavipes]
MCDQATEAGGLVPPLQSLTKTASLRRLFLAKPLAMELPLASPASCELRSVIRFLAAKKKSAKEIHEELCQVYGEECMSSGMVRRWVRDFKNGRTDIHDEAREGGHRLPTKQLPKSKRQCLKIDGLQFGNCAKDSGGQQNHN